MLYCIPLNSGDTFLPYLMEEIGITTDMIGVVMAVRAAMEIPVLLGFHKLRTRFSLPTLLVFQCGCYMPVSYTHLLRRLSFCFGIQPDDRGRVELADFPNGLPQGKLWARMYGADIYKPRCV